eukprot:1652505-Rhodomonas_salina.1
MYKYQSFTTSEQCKEVHTCKDKQEFKKEKYRSRSEKSGLSLGRTTKAAPLRTIAPRSENSSER